MIRAALGVFTLLITIHFGIMAFILVDQVKPCPTEDSVNCTWYGPFQGSKGGRIVVNW